MKSYSIGRDAGCDIVLNDNTDVISRRHAVLTVASSGKMTITDLSTNGTYINGQRISSNVAVPVTRKDSVSFAHVSTLDWNMIPKSNQWLTYLIIGLVVCAIGAACAIFIPKAMHRSDQPNLPSVVDSIACTITFDANGGQGMMEPERINKGQKVGLIKNKVKDKESITREGFVFTGWNTNSDGSGTSYEDGEDVIFYNDVILYAQWKQKTHTITFIQNDRKVGGKMEAQTVPEGTDTALTPCAYTKKGFRFKGWNTESNGKGKAYKDGDKVNLKEDLKLYAQWEEVKAKDKDQEKDKDVQEEEVKPML